MNRSNKMYVMTPALLEQFEELVANLQNLFLDLYSNYEIGISEPPKSDSDLNH